MKDMVGPETTEFLLRQKNLVLATIASGGAPQLSPVWYLWTGEVYAISTIDTTAKWLNLHRDPRCSVCVDDPDTGQMVVAYGRARLITGDAVQERTWPIVAKYYPGDDDAAAAHMRRIFDSDQERVIIDVVPHKTIARRLDLDSEAD